MGGGASRGRPPRGGGKGPVVIPPIVVDPGAGDDDNNFLGDTRDGREEEILFDDPNEGQGEDDEDDVEEGDEDEVQVVTQSNKSTSDGFVPFDPEIHDVTGYEKADIIRLRNTAFKGNVKYAKKVKGALLGLPSGSIPTLQQINSSELFALRAPQKGKSENDDEDEEGPPKEANIHQLWLPFLQGNKALGDCPPAQFEPPGDWPKVYTSQGLQTYFPMGVTARKSRVSLPSLIIVVPPILLNWRRNTWIISIPMQPYRGTHWELENQENSLPFVPTVGFDQRTRCQPILMRGDTSMLNSSVRHMQSSILVLTP